MEWAVAVACSSLVGGAEVFVDTSGSGVSVRADASRERPLRIVTFNARRLSQREPRRANEVGAMLRSLAPDICALQEIAHGGALVRIARASRLEHVTFERHAPFAPRGIGLLSSNAPLERGGGRLPARRGDDKGFTRAVVALPAGARLAGALELIAVHLDPFSYASRQSQIAALSTSVGARTMPRIVLGDFNAMTLGAWASRKTHDETVHDMADALGVDVPACAWPRTFPSRFPVFSIDWVLASSELEVRAAESVVTRLSDHAAVVAEIATRA